MDLAVSLAVAAALCFHGPAQEKADTSAPTAQDVFYEGSARYSAADYPGAIEKFTQALALATREGLPFRVRGAFLVNLGRAHVRAYGVNDDAKHLKMAKEIYERYQREAAAAEFTGPDDDEVQKELDQVHRLLEATAAAPTEEEPRREPDTKPADPAGADPELTDDGGGRRPLHIGLLSSGSVLVAGGVSVLVWGSTFRSYAQDQIPEDEQGTPEAGAFVDDETRKGRILMGVGGGLAAVGLAGVVVGAVGLARAKRSDVQLAVSPTWGGLAISGRF